PGREKGVCQAAGYIVPLSQVTVSPKVSGEVVELNLEEGKVVKKGDILARLEATEYKSDLDAAKARLDLASARLDKIKGNANEKDLAIARAEVALAKAELEKAQWRLDATIIRAPVSGTILTKKAEVGNVVNPAAFNITASICEMADLRKLEVEV